MEAPEGVRYYYSNVYEQCCACGAHTLTQDELRELSALRTVARPKATVEDPEYLSSVKALWTVLWPTEEWSAVSSNWRAFGFQSNDPITDFRGAGLLGLKQLLYLATVYPKEFSEIRGTSEDYPFAISALNITYHLKYSFQLAEETNASLPHTLRARPRQMKAFARLNNQDIDVINESYVFAVILMHNTWLSCKRRPDFDLMQFSKCIEKGVSGLMGLFQQEPRTIKEFKALIFS